MNVTKQFQSVLKLSKYGSEFNMLVKTNQHVYHTSEVFIPPANEVSGVYSDPYVRPFVRPSVRPSLPISNPLLL